MKTASIHRNVSHVQLALSPTRPIPRLAFCVRQELKPQHQDHLNAFRALHPLIQPQQARLPVEYVTMGSIRHLEALNVHPALLDTAASLARVVLVYQASIPALLLQHHVTPALQDSINRTQEQDYACHAPPLHMQMNKGLLLVLFQFPVNIIH